MFVEGPVTLAIHYVIGCFSSVDGPLPLILDQGKSENASQILEAQEHIFSNLKDPKQKCSLFPIRSTYLVFGTINTPELRLIPLRILPKIYHQALIL
jgi:hypothetical protein